MMLTIRNINEIIERQVHALRIRKRIDLSIIHVECIEIFYFGKKQQ